MSAILDEFDWVFRLRQINLNMKFYIFTLLEYPNVSCSANSSVSHNCDYLLCDGIGSLREVKKASVIVNYSCGHLTLSLTWWQGSSLKELTGESFQVLLSASIIRKISIMAS